jgi:hypothetical protein
MKSLETMFIWILAGFAIGFALILSLFWYLERIYKHKAKVRML